MVGVQRHCPTACGYGFVLKLALIEFCAFIWTIIEYTGTLQYNSKLVQAIEATTVQNTEEDSKRIYSQ